MKNLKQFLLLAVLLLAGLGAKAHDFEVDEIYYNITSSSTVEVTHKGGIVGGPYGWFVTIPSSVQYNNKMYSVTSIGKESFRNSNTRSI